MSDMTEQDRGLTSRIGPVEVDWPRSIGYFGGVGLATAAGLLSPPVGVFIAAVPFLKMLNRPNASRPVRFIGQVLDGASKPVGGDTSATIELAAPDASATPDKSGTPNRLGAPVLPATRRPGILAEARQIADRARGGRVGTADGESGAVPTSS